jgi:internalin A
LGEQDPIPRGLFAEVTWLDLGGEGDFDDSGLRLLADLSNLEALRLSATRVSDLTPLIGLTNLEYLVLGWTPVADLEPLAGLTALQGLYFQGTQVSDLTPLIGLTNLRRLGLHGTPVAPEQVEALQNALPNLKIETQHVGG